MPEETARIVLTTTDSAESANRIAHELVERRLAACVNIIPNLTSIYRWKGAVESASETLLLIKTSSASLAALEAALRELIPTMFPNLSCLPLNPAAACISNGCMRRSAPDLSTDRPCSTALPPDILTLGFHARSICGIRSEHGSDRVDRPRRPASYS